MNGSEIFFLIYLLLLGGFILAGVVSVVIVVRNLARQDKRFEPSLCPRCGCDIDAQTGSCPDCEMSR
jgi:hypothetical protein